MYCNVISCAIISCDQVRCEYIDAIDAPKERDSAVVKELGAGVAVREVKPLKRHGESSAKAIKSANSSRRAAEYAILSPKGCKNVQLIII